MRGMPRCAGRRQPARLHRDGQEAAMRKRCCVRRAGAVVLAALALAGCGALAGSKAGGPGAPVVLRMATVYGLPGFMPQVDPYLVNRVAKLSAGDVQIDMAYPVALDAPGGEHQLVPAVPPGNYDSAAL